MASAGQAQGTSADVALELIDTLTRYVTCCFLGRLRAEFFFRFCKKILLVLATPTYDQLTNCCKWLPRMSDLLCCFSRRRPSRQGRGYRALAGRRALSVSYNPVVSSALSAAADSAYEAPLVTPSGKPPRFEDFVLHKTIGRGSFGRVSWVLHECACGRRGTKCSH